MRWLVILDVVGVLVARRERRRTAVEEAETAGEGWPWVTGSAEHGLTGDPSIGSCDRSRRHRAGR